MSIPLNLTKTTAAFLAQSAISFGVSFLGLLFGICYLPLDMWQRLFLAMAGLFLVSSTFGLAKVVRDMQKASTVRVRIDEARIDKLLNEHDPLRTFTAAKPPGEKHRAAAAAAQQHLGLGVGIERVRWCGGLKCSTVHSEQCGQLLCRSLHSHRATPGDPGAQRVIHRLRLSDASPASHRALGDHASPRADREATAGTEHVAHRHGKFHRPSLAA